jgi:hypothetical protein
MLPFMVMEEKIDTLKWKKILKIDSHVRTKIIVNVVHSMSPS